MMRVLAIFIWLWATIIITLWAASAQAADVTVNYSTATGAQAVDAGHPLPVDSVAPTSGGWTPKQLTGITNSAQNIKTTAGQLAKVHCDNNNAAWTYLQVFNATAANVTVGTTAPVDVVPLAPSVSGGFVLSVGEAFSTAISVAAATTATGGSAPSTSINCGFAYQ